jgi:hypothetical protein
MYNLAFFSNFVRGEFRQESSLSRLPTVTPSEQSLHQKRAEIYLALEEMLVDLEHQEYMPPDVRLRREFKENYIETNRVDGPVSENQAITPDPFAMQVLQVFKNENRMLSIAEVHSLHARLFSEDLLQKSIEKKLYSMSKKGWLERCIGRRGQYRLPRHS